MKIAIIGPAGSGKSTITRLIKATSEYGDDYTKVIECDAEVNKIYSDGDPDNPVLSFLSKVCPKCIRFERCEPTPIMKAFVDKKVLGSFLLIHPKERMKIEDLIFRALKDQINSAEYYNGDEKIYTVIVDGILPRFLKKFKFDYVLYVHTDEKERVKRLKGRGVTPKRIKEILNVQKKMFRSPIIEEQSKKKEAHFHFDKYDNSLKKTYKP